MVYSSKKKDLVTPIKEKLIRMTTAFCKQSLNEEYEELCRKMIEKMARKKQVPFMLGQLENWAASVVYAIGSFNFLQDKSTKPYVPSDDIANFFGVSKSTMQQKAAVIKNMFKMVNPFFGSEFATRDMIERSPFRNLAMTQDGYLVQLPDEMVALIR